jgi:hypothetical protein
VLQAILGETWIGSDIDMYVSEDHVTGIRRDLSSMGYYREGWPDPIARDDENDYFFSRIGSHLESLEVWLSNAPKADAWKNVDRREIRGMVAQRSAGELHLMVVRESLPRVEEIVHGFDLDIVMNTWDGTTLSIANPDALVHRTANASEYTSKMISAYGSAARPSQEKLDRLLALEQEALLNISDFWDRSWENSTKEGLKAVFRKVFERISKYMMRGYKIMVHKDPGGHREEWTPKSQVECIRWLQADEPDTDDECTDTDDSDASDESDE